MVVQAISARWRSRPFCLAWLLGTLAVSHLAGIFLPGQWWLPVLNGGLFFLLFFGPLREGEYWTAVRLALLWAGLTIILQVGLTVLWPSAMERAVWHGTAYREEMFAWVRSGAGAEGDIRLFLPVHLRHLAIFCVVSLASGGLFGLVMGAAMLGYMDFYVGSLIAASGGHWSAILLGWQVWALARVAGFILAGTALGAVFVHRPVDLLDKRNRVLRMLAAALGLIALDILLKWALAGSYQHFLSGALAALP